MIHRSPLPDVAIPSVPLTEYVLQQADALGDKPALTEGLSGRTVSYAALKAAVLSLAGGLLARGLARGEVVALMAPNLPEYAVVFHGVAAAGGILTTINPTYTERELHHQLEDSGATLLVTVPAFLPVARAAAAGTAVREIVVIGEADGATPLAALMGAPLSAPVDAAPDDVVALPYSSGTTGVAKGVMLTHRNLIANIAQTVGSSRLEENELLVAVLPFFHIYGMQVMMNTGLAVGATVITLPRFELEQFLRVHQQYRVTRSFVAPPIVVLLAKHPLVAQYDLSTLKRVLSAAAPLSAELALEAGARIGCDVVQGYGMTELSPVSHFTPQGEFKPGSVGVSVPNTETLIVDSATRLSLGVGEDGEVWVRGPQVMKGYWNNPDATRSTIDADGWLHTGDIGHVDADGHLYIVDRLKELIKYKGFQVAPAELEALLLTHPAVADAAVVGRPDPEAGELPVGFVVLKAGFEAPAAEIMAWVAGQTASYKHLRALYFIEAVPKSPSGKILRRVLKERVRG
jgi:acyl-CoA synthetase (AMP-forming)/AMP-acid ligase II